MLKTQFPLASLFACSLLLTMGAINYQPASPAATTARPDFVETTSFDACAQVLSPEELLARAIEGLDPAKASWLRLKIWQKQIGDVACFEAESRLLRGPNQCARLTMTIRARQTPVTIVVVSDGIGLAHACTLPGKPVQMETTRFVTASEKPLEAGDIEHLLNAHGCGGPHWLLKDVQVTLGDLQITVGTWKGTPVYRLSGRVQEGTQNPSEMPPCTKPRTCYLYLDVHTLWPHRVEWWATEGADPVLQIEFRDPEINHALTDEDCAREFTYLPD